MVSVVRFSIGKLLQTQKLYRRIPLGTKVTKVPGIKYKEVGNLYGLRNWVEYGLKQSKNELGWADFRVTDYSQIEKWWELIMSAYLLVSLHARVLNNRDEQEANPVQAQLITKFSTHDWWDKGQGWKNLLNNLRLIIQLLSCSICSSLG